MNRHTSVAAATSCLAFLCLATLFVSQRAVAQSDRQPTPSGIVLNEVLASNRSGRLDEQGNTSDWLELSNRGSKAVSLDGYHLSDDPSNPLKWKLPPDVIAPGGFYVVSMSGLDRRSLAPEVLLSSAATIPFETTLVKDNAAWRYAVPETERTESVAGWTRSDFDDSNFRIGRAGFGYGDDDDETGVREGTTVVLLRHEFILDKPLTSGGLVLQVDYDDGFVAYLNGTRVAASNGPAGEPGFKSTAQGSHEAGSPERFDLSAHVALLRPGKNILAVAGLNTHPGSSDLSIKPSLGTLPPLSHANFRLKKKGGDILLVAPDGEVADRLTYGEQRADQSLGRTVQAPGDWGYFLTPTPGRANLGPQQKAPVKSRVWFNPKPGVCEEGVKVTINQESSTATEIRFTTDGSNPNAESSLYEGPIDVDGTSIFRAAAFVGDERASATAAATYMPRGEVALPILSISMEPEDFRDVHLTVSASGRGGERPAFLELLNSKGNRRVATGFGLRLHGGAGRRGGLDRKKSYRGYFRKTYGEGRVGYNIIPDAELKKFDKLVLRSSSNDGGTHGTFIRDQVIRDLHHNMGCLASRGAWYELLVNGVNHGVYNVTERMDEDFFTAHLGPGDYDVMKTGETLLSGTRESWDSLRRFVSSTDLSVPANFDELASRIDIENFTAYMILNLWAQNFDWPHNNWYAARRVPDGKWSFLCWDAEWAFAGGPTDSPITDPYAFIDSGGAYGFGMSRTIFFALLGNADYRNYYQSEVKRHLNGALSKENALRQVRKHRDIIASATEREFNRRRADFGRWRRQVAIVEDFASKCGDQFRQYTERYFSYQHSVVSEDRVAISEAPDGRRFIMYRDEAGHVRELASTANGSIWKDSAVGSSANAPRCAGSVLAYSIGTEDRRVVYRDAQGHLHELASDNGPWRHVDLTELLKQPPASCDPSVAIANGVPHIVYVDQTARIHELSFKKGSWQHHQLPAAPKPTSAAVISTAAGEMRVTYRTMFGSPCQLTQNLSSAQDGQRQWRPRLIHRLPAKGQPIGIQVDGKRRVIFHAAKEWPAREPFVFFGPDYRGPDYKGPRDVLVDAAPSGERFWRLAPIQSGSSVATGNPIGIPDSTGSTQCVLYRDAAGHLQEISRVDGDWKVRDITKLARAPLAESEPTGLVSKKNHRHYAYKDKAGDVYEVRFDGQWSTQNLTAASKTGTKAAGE